MVHASWLDNVSGTITPNRTNTLITAGAPTTTDVVASPGSGTRNVKTMTVYNSSAGSSTGLTIQHTDGSTVSVLFKYTLGAGETIQYFDTLGFQVIDAAGGLKLSPSAGRLLKRSVVTGGTTFTSTAATTSLLVRCIGSGGSGGGNPATASTAGSGGGAGGYVDKLYTAQPPNKTFTIAIGAAKTGTSGAIGTAGGATTFTAGVTLITANGGSAGLLAVAATSVAGGAGAAISTNGDVNGSGDPGEDGISSATALQGGSGGSTPYGAGGGTSTTNLAVGKN